MSEEQIRTFFNVNARYHQQNGERRRYSIIPPGRVRPIYASGTDVLFDDLKRAISRLEKA